MLYLVPIESVEQIEFTMDGQVKKMVRLKLLLHTTVMLKIAVRLFNQIL